MMRMIKEKEGKELRNKLWKKKKRKININIYIYVNKKNICNQDK